jgi:outer membrane protein OmpA-like peptidoglycan-associated protein
MSFNLLDAVKGQFNSDLITKAASFLGESESGISKAISGIIPAVVSSLVSKTSSGSSGAAEVLNLARETNNSSLFDNLSGLLGNMTLLNKGTSLFKSLFGDKTSGVINAVSDFAGISNSSTSSLFSMAVPAALASLGRHVSENNLGTTGLTDLLNSQRGWISNALPASLSSIAGLLNLNKITNAVSTGGSNARKAVSRTAGYTERKAKSSWLLPALLLLAAAFLLWWFLLGGKNGCNSANTGSADTTLHSNTDRGTDGVNPVITTLGKVDSISGDFIYDPGTLKFIELPNGAGKLEAGENSTEARLVAFLNDESKVIDTVKGNWYELTNVRFKSGSSTLTDESLVQLQNMVMIAKAYPSAKFKLGGYTDNTGDSIKNVVLSKKRAETVLAKLKELGADAASLAGAEGYGPQWPIGDNNTAEGRAMNRRVAVNVKAK